MGREEVGRGASTPIALFHTFPQTACMDTAENQTDRRKPRWNPFRRTTKPNPTQDPSIVQVMAQWTEYELIFNDILTRLNAQLARHAKMEKKLLERTAQELGASPDANPAPAPGYLPNSKAALRSQYATGRYGGRVEELLKAKVGRNVGDNQNGEVRGP